MDSLSLVSHFIVYTHLEDFTHAWFLITLVISHPKISSLKERTMNYLNFSEPQILQVWITKNSWHYKGSMNRWVTIHGSGNLLQLTFYSHSLFFILTKQAAHMKNIIGMKIHKRIPWFLTSSKKEGEKIEILSNLMKGLNNGLNPTNTNPSDQPQSSKGKSF